MQSTNTPYIVTGNTVILHLQYLLRRHSCVIMPHLGAMIATEQPAVVNEEWGVVCPPVREISFNAAIVNNDGLLATSIARRERISYEAACRCMEEEIDQMRRTLDQGVELSLGRVGTLSRTPDGRLTFQPSLRAESKADLLGYSAVQLPAAKSANEVATHAVDSRYYHLRIPRRAVRIAASLAMPIICALGILLWTMRITHTPEQYTGAERIDYASVIPVPHSEASTSSAEIEPAQHVETALGTIVVAVFDSQAKAQLFLKQHDDSPYALHVEKHGRSWRVCAAADSPRSALLQLLHTTDFIVEYPGAWILMR